VIIASENILFNGFSILRYRTVASEKFDFPAFLEDAPVHVVLLRGPSLLSLRLAAL
jgi:hypothetical protein